MKWPPLKPMVKSTTKSMKKKRERFKPLSDRLPDRLKTHKQRVQTISSILPNAATVLALCAGLSSVRFALEIPRKSDHDFNCSKQFQYVKLAIIFQRWSKKA